MSTDAVKAHAVNADAVNGKGDSVKRSGKTSNPVAAAAHAVGYGAWLIGQVYLGAWEILKRTVRPNMGYCPVVVEYPLRVRSPRLIAAFSTSITMTPGTMSIGLRHVDAEGVPTVLLVHAVFGEDPQAVLAGLADMEERLSPAARKIARPQAVSPESTPSASPPEEKTR